MLEHAGGTADREIALLSVHVILRII